MELPEAVARATRPLFAALPPEQALHRVVVAPSAEGPGSDLEDLVASALASGAVAAGGPLEAGLWLYIDDLERSHKVAQGLPDATGSYWHGIMHRREGDFSNSHHWFRKVGPHPAIGMVGYDPHRFVDDVEAAWRADPAQVPQPLVSLQRREWQTLFAWCATGAA